MSVTRFAGAKTINSAGANVIDRTSPLQMDGNITIGLVQVPLNNTYVLTNAALTRNAANDISINQAASLTSTIGFFLGEYFKEVTALLGVASVPPLNNSGQYADNSGDSPLPKGSMVTALQLAYSVQTANLTSFNVTMVNNVMVNGVANAATTLLNNATVAPLTTTASATTCNVVSIAIPTPAFDVALASQPSMELTVVTPATSTFRLYSVGLVVTYNYL